MTPAEQQAAADAKQKAAIAAFSARKTPAKTTTMGSAFSLAEKSARIKAARAVVTATMTTTDAGKTTRTELADTSQVGSALDGLLYTAKEAASANNLAGKPRYTRTISIVIEVRLA